MVGMLLALTSSVGYSGSMGCMAPCAAPGKIYVGVFGGSGSSNKFHINQYGTAFYTEAAGGPLAVNAFGKSNNPSKGFFGAHLGYQWAEILVNPCYQWGIAPAVELEGYYIGKTTFTAHDVNNNTARLPEHDFVVKYPTKTDVFLGNVILNLNVCSSAFHPYLGLGIGSAINSIRHADAKQVSPPEAGINHFNSHSSDRAATFAGQAKIGLRYDICNFSVFADYRWVYLSSTSYAFGSTVYTGHPETSNWQVKMNPRNYSLGTIGIQYSI